jgi:hypothetical protein
MKFSLLPKPGDSLVHYILFYLIGCSVSFPMIYFFLSGDLAANFNFSFFAKHCVQGIALGAIAGISVYWFEISRRDSEVKS